MKAKVHERNARGSTQKILAICDANLIGKKFQQRGMILDLKLYREFYDGEKVTEEQAVKMIMQADNANIVGKKAVKCAEKALGKVKAKKIAGIPHLQLYRV